MGVLDLINKMNDGVSELKRKFNAKFHDVEVYNGIIYFKLLKEDKYYDAILRATFDISYTFNDVVLIRDIVTPDFSKLYANDEIKNLISQMKDKTCSKFHHFRMLIICDEIMVSAVFEIGLHHRFR